MDAALLAWARAVKRPGKHPPLWLFTDARRLPDPLAAIAQLPRGLAGVVFRPDGSPAQAALAKPIAALCRARRLPLVVAGDARLAAAMGAGVHLRQGRWQGPVRTRRLRTSSAHNRVELLRARRQGAKIIFLSAAFATASHPGAPGLGAVRWLKIAQKPGEFKVYALGGVSGENIRSLARSCGGVGGISGLIP
jgi:thiamine-phosphate pyrophosphorylase